MKKKEIRSKKEIFNFIISDAHLMLAVVEYMKAYSMKSFDEFYEEMKKFVNTGEVK